MTVGKFLKIAVSIVIAIVVLNLVYFAFHWNVWVGVVAVIIAIIIAQELYKFIKKPLTGGRFW